MYGIEVEVMFEFSSIKNTVSALGRCLMHLSVMLLFVPKFKYVRDFGIFKINSSVRFLLSTVRCTSRLGRSWDVFLVGVLELYRSRGRGRGEKDNFSP